MRALSVRQPWAELIASGRKSIEVRTWHTAHRGALAICSTASVDASDCRAYGMAPSAVARGCVVCVVDLVDVRQGRHSDARGACCSAVGAYAWVLANPIRCEPHEVKGKLSLWWLDDALVVPCKGRKLTHAPQVQPTARKRADDDEEPDPRAMLAAWSRDVEARKRR